MSFWHFCGALGNDTGREGQIGNWELGIGARKKSLLLTAAKPLALAQANSRFAFALLLVHTR
ncbi:MAG: hypothetical protein M3O33_22455 [Cyanobacteriota bacterium]|nr:hypothetical protein [Cyanobacteriota bacterium]